jgi:hypothetical protein
MPSDFFSQAPAILADARPKVIVVGGHAGSPKSKVTTSAEHLGFGRKTVFMHD